MQTTVRIDDQLLKRAIKVGGHKTNEDAVKAAVEEYVRRRKQAAIIPPLGTIDYDAGYKYKRERTGKSKMARRCSLPLIRSKHPGSLRIDNKKIYELISFP